MILSPFDPPFDRDSLKLIVLYPPFALCVCWCRRPRVVLEAGLASNLVRIETTGLFDNVDVTEVVADVRLTERRTTRGNRLQWIIEDEGAMHFPKQRPDYLNAEFYIASSLSVQDAHRNPFLRDGMLAGYRRVLPRESSSFSLRSERRTLVLKLLQQGTFGVGIAAVVEPAQGQNLAPSTVEYQDTIVESKNHVVGPAVVFQI